MITSGQYAVGTLLPTEPELSVQFELSRQTIREALRNLAAQGLVTRQPGVGTRVVRSTPTIHGSYSIASMAELEEYADEARLHADCIEEVAVEGEQARLLDCSDGALWWHIKGSRYRRADNVPIGVTEIYLRAWFPGVEAHIRRLTGAIHVMLERQYDAFVEEIRQDACAVLLTPSEAKVLGSTPGAPGLEVVRRYYLADEKLVLRGRIVYAADRFGFSLRFRRSRENP
jgi:GntR family transcriptional regulator